MTGNEQQTPPPPKCHDCKNPCAMKEDNTYALRCSTCLKRERENRRTKRRKVGGGGSQEGRRQNGTASEHPTTPGLSFLGGGSAGSSSFSSSSSASNKISIIIPFVVTYDKNAQVRSEIVEQIKNILTSKGFTCDEI